MHVFIVEIVTLPPVGGWGIVFARFLCFFVCFFVSNITRKRPDRFAWNFHFKLFWWLSLDSPVTFDVKFRQAENYPVDLYYVMDMSNSMKDDKARLALLGDLLGQYDVCIGYPDKQVWKVLRTRKGVHATVVTAGHCTHAELTSGHALASCYSCSMHSRVCAN